MKEFLETEHQKIGTYTRLFTALNEHGGHVKTPTKEYDALRFSVKTDEKSPVELQHISITTNPPKQNLSSLNDPENTKNWLRIFITPNDPQSLRIGQRSDEHINYDTECKIVHLAKTGEVTEESVWGGIHANSIRKFPGKIIKLKPHSEDVKNPLPEEISPLQPASEDTLAQLDTIIQKLESEDFEKQYILY